MPAPALRLVGADFVDDGRSVVASAVGGGLTVVDARDGRALRRAAAHPGIAEGVRASPDGRRAAGVVDGVLHVWDVSTAAELSAVPVGSPQAPVSWSPDGRRLAAVRDGRLLLVDVASGGVEVAGLRDVVAAAFTPDGQRVVTAHSAPATADRSGGDVDDHVDVHDLSTWRLEDSWPADATALAVTADGQHVVTAQQDGDVVVRHLRSRAAVTLAGHVSRVLDLAPGPDGSLATAGQDGSVRLWDLTTGVQSLRLLGHDSAVSTVRWSRDGTRLVTSSWDGSVRVWALALDDLVRLAHGRLSRELSDDECRRYLQQERCP